MMKTFNAYDYPVTGTVKMPDGTTLPMLGIPMMSDERWNELPRETAVRNYRKQFSREPESVEQAVCWHRHGRGSFVRSMGIWMNWRGGP